MLDIILNKKFINFVSFIINIDYTLNISVFQFVMKFFFVKIE